MNARSKAAPGYLDAAKGGLIIPNMTKASFVVGAPYGTCAFLDAQLQKEWLVLEWSCEVIYDAQLAETRH